MGKPSSFENASHIRFPKPLRFSMFLRSTFELAFTTCSLACWFGGKVGPSTLSFLMVLARMSACDPGLGPCGRRLRRPTPCKRLVHRSHLLTYVPCVQ
eukprot:5616070-Amphidinium_carterae.1